MNEVKVTGRTIRGIQVQTINANEMDESSAKITPLWQQFYSEIIPNLTDVTCMYGVYHSYESDEHGQFTVLAGVEASTKNNSDLQQVSMVDISIQSGNYLMFSDSGEMPQVVIDIWTKIWAFFDTSLEVSTHDKPTYERAFTTDFEVYRSANDVDVYIAIK